MGVLRAIVLGVISLGACLAPARGAHAQAGAAVTTTVDPCVRVDPEQLRRVLSIELGTSIEYGTDGSGAPGVTSVHVSCSDAGIELRLEDGVTRKTMSRVLDTSHIEAGSLTRLLALAVAEFVVASWVELRINDKPSVEPAGPPPDPALRSAAEQVVRSREPAPASVEPVSQPARAELAWHVGALFRLEGWSSQVGWAPSFALRIGQRPSEHFAFAIGGDVGLTRVDVPQGQVQLTLGSVVAALLFATSVGRLDMFAGGGGRFGFVRMNGLAAAARLHGEDFAAPYGGPIAQAGLAYRTSRTFQLLMEAEAGLVTLPVVGLSGRRRVVEVDGAWASIGVGIGAAL